MRGIIPKPSGMSTEGNMVADFFEMEVHRLGIDQWQDKPCTAPARGADGSEQPHRAMPLVAQRGRS